jgi:hypothetical protein
MDQIMWRTIFPLVNTVSDAAFSATHKDPIHCFKADTHTTVRVMLRVPYLPADNPQQSEEASHMGGNANCKSRKSTKGGPHEITESNGGYHELYTVGLPLFLYAAWWWAFEISEVHLGVQMELVPKF